MPAVEKNLSRFQAANTQVLGVSIDSVFVHANWAKDLGGISFPLLADFHPKGQMAEAYGLYLADKGITDRATVIIDANGVVQYAKSVTPAGERDIDELVTECEKINSAYSGDVAKPRSADGVPSGATLFVKSNCGFSRAALLARDNLHLGTTVTVKNISEDGGAKDELKKLTSKEQAPCLVVNNEPMFESKDIVDFFVNRTSPLV